MPDPGRERKKRSSREQVSSQTTPINVEEDNGLWGKMAGKCPEDSREKGHMSRSCWQTDTVNNKSGDFAYPDLKKKEGTPQNSSSYRKGQLQNTPSNQRARRPMLQEKTGSRKRTGPTLFLDGNKERSEWIAPSLTRGLPKARKGRSGGSKITDKSIKATQYHM